MWTLHLDESPYDKRAALLGGYEWLEAHHALDDRLLAAHCVHASSRDVRLLRRHDVKVAHQATSNGYLASGTAPIPEMLQAGITVGLGTDDANCNDGVNLFADMKVMYLAQRARTLDPGVVTPEKIVEAVTIDAARAVGMADRIGSLEPGKLADLAIVELNEPELTPLYDVYSHLVYAIKGSHVRTVVVDGKLVVRERRMTTLDTDQVLARCRQIQRRILKSLGRPTPE
jgi:atrazine chlorohydrolase/5-methylthioadenosine/S-adenosylhomocysteine deaminase/melamine deaminase